MLRSGLLTTRMRARLLTTPTRATSSKTGFAKPTIRTMPGNHDNWTGRDTGPDNLYNQYFGPERYEALEQTAGWQARDASHHPWKEGDNDNHYDLFSAEGLEFVVVSLGYDVTEEEAAWAD